MLKNSKYVIKKKRYADMFLFFLIVELRIIDKYLKLK